MSAASRSFHYRFFAPLQEGFQSTERWIEYVARAGYLAIGIVYAIVGFLAIHAAVSAARSPDTRDALETVLGVPFGRVLLGLLAIGLFSYAAWRFVQAWWDTERKGQEWKGLFIRIGYVFSGIAYIALGIASLVMAIRGGGSGSSDGSRNGEHAAEVLQWPGGWIVLIIIGGIVVTVGIVHFVKAYNADFMRDYEHTEMSPVERNWAKPVGQFGLAARGVTFCLIGLFIALAGWRTNAGEVKGLGEAFAIVSAQPFGQVMLFIVAAGFVAYGLFCLSQARYRRIAKL